MITSNETTTILTPGELLTTTMYKPTSTTKETLIIIPITSFTATPIWNNIVTSNDNCKKVVIGDLVEARINRLIVIAIKHEQQHLI